MNEDELVEHYRQQAAKRDRTKKQAEDKALRNQVAPYMLTVDERCEQLAERIEASPTQGGQLIDRRVLWPVATELKTSTRDAHDYQMGGEIRTTGYQGEPVVHQSIHRDYGWVRTDTTTYYMTFDGAIVSRIESEMKTGPSVIPLDLGPLTESSREAIGVSLAMVANPPAVPAPTYSDEPHRIGYQLQFASDLK